MALKEILKDWFYEFGIDEIIEPFKEIIDDFKE
jgi:hypothetical protein